MAQTKFTTVLSSREIGRSDYVQVEFIVENASHIENLVPPTFPNFHVVEGPIQSSGMSIVNGNTSQYKGVSFVLQPLKTGKFNIAGATADIDGKAMRSNTVTIEVSANGSSNTPPPALQPVWPDDPADAAREYILKPGENASDKIKKNLFVRVQADKTTCYLGEPVVVTYKLYSRLRSESRVTRRPSLNGFSVYDMTDPNRDMASVETLNGKQYAVHIIRKAQLIPLQPGVVELDPAEVENKVYFIRQSASGQRRRSLLDDFFGMPSEAGEETSQNVTLQSQSLAITIKPLPESNKPADFNGAVGHFTMNAELERKKIPAGDAGSLKVTIKGKGNLTVVNAPSVKWPDSVDAYDPTAKEDIDKTVSPMSGSKTFDYVFSPRKQGTYELPPVEFSYFDPASATYKSIQSPAFHFEVTAAAKHAKHNVLQSVETESLLKTFLQQHLEWIFAILILSGLAVYLWRQNTRLKKAEFQVKAVTETIKSAPENQIQVAVPEPPDPLQKPRRLLADGDYPGFYRELNRSVWDTLKSLNLPASELNKHNVAHYLRARGWDDNTIGLLEQTLNECELNLYTPDHNESNMYQVLQQAETLLKLLREA